jgi:uncharacterized protein DUF2568
MIAPLNLALRFACEVAAIVAVVWWGWPILGIVLGLAVIAVWAVAVAPKSARRLPDPFRFGVELVIFGCATAAFAGVGHEVLAVVFAILGVGTAGAVRIWPEPIEPPAP